MNDSAEVTDLGDLLKGTMDWDSTMLVTNETLVVMEEWRLILDKVATVIMTVDTICLTLGMGAAIYWKQIWGHLRRPIGCFIGMTCQFFVLPATAFGLAVGFKFTTLEALGAMIVSCSPGGSFSNFFAYWMDGDLALSIVMTTCSCTLAFLGMPLNLWLYSRHWIDPDDSNFVLPYRSIIISLCFIMGPVMIGMIIRNFSERIATKITKIASIIGYILTATVLAIWIALYWQVFTNATPFIYLATWILPVLGFTLAYIVAKLTCRTHKVARTIGIETGSQNMPVALSIILLSFPDPAIKSEMIIFPTMYAIILLIEMFAAIGAFQLWKRYCHKKSSDAEDEKDGYPMTHKAKIEKGTSEEKEKMKV